MAEDEDTNAYKFSKKAKEYELTARQHTGFTKEGERKEFVEGDKVWLEPHQYEAFKDKFVPANKKDREAADNEADGSNLTATQPQEQVGEKKDKAPNAPSSSASDKAAGAKTADELSKDGVAKQTGAGAAQNSTNTAKV